MTNSAYNLDFDDTLPTYISLWDLTKFYRGDWRHRSFFPADNDYKNYSKFDYVIRRNQDGEPSIMQCSRCGLKWEVWRMNHKVLECSNQVFVNEIEKYKQESGIQVKCISDRILLYLRYGLDQLIPVNKTTTQSIAFINANETNEQIREFIIDKYNYYIRGDPDYLGKHPATVAATLIYTCLLSKTGLENVSQARIADALNVSKQSVRQYYLILATRVFGQDVANHLKLKARERIRSGRNKTEVIV